MPKPDVVLGDKSRVGMLRGFESMARLLALTLGPVQGTIINEVAFHGAPELLHDAATIARRIIQLPDRTEDAGAMLMRHMVWHMRQEVGDGSATTAVLAMAIAREMQRMVAAGANAMMLRRGIERASQVAEQALDQMAIPLEGEERIAAVASAAVGNAEIGKLLGEIYDLLGPAANVIIEPYVAAAHDRVYHEGARFKGGYLSPYLINDQTRRVAVLEQPWVLVGDVNFETLLSIQNALELAFSHGAKSLLIVCRVMNDKAIGVMVANNEKGIIQSCAANLKPVGEVRRVTIQNIALLTGGRALFDQLSQKAEEITLQDFGRAERAVVASDYLTIIGGHGDKQAIRERVNSMRRRLRETTDKEEREMLREVQAHFSAGVAELRVSALTSKERNELTEIAQQAMKSVVAGMESGIVPGGGAAYLACIPTVEALQAEGDEAIGVQILARALEEPMRCIVGNVGEHPPVAIAAARKAGAGFGFDVRTRQMVNMLEAGIADPTLVVKRALQQAVSGAIMLQTTDALVLHRKPKEAYEP